MSVLNNAFMAGLETTFGTAADLTTAVGLEVRGHSYQYERNLTSSNAPRPGAQGEQADRNVSSARGGGGSFNHDVMTKGFDLWLPGLLGSLVQGPTQFTPPGGLANIWTAATTIGAPAGSYTLQGLQHDVSTDPHVFTHLGSVITDWSLSHTVASGSLTFNANFTSSEVVKDVPAGTPNYPAGARPYDGKNLVGEVVIDGGGNRCVQSLNLDVNLGWIVGRECLDGTTTQKRPARATWPTITGTVTMDWHGDDLQDKYLEGANVPLAITYTGEEIEPGVNESFTVDMPAIILTADPIVTFNNGNANQVPQMTMPFRVQHDQNLGDMVTIEYVSTIV